ncbi:ABC transporter substrate-binding protein [Nocardia cerradoensis]|uniref:ABC transporter substrate-binding protein n=1 Tax=Nocardia cerradoensis TaxID=85688 RepID=UPI0002D2EFD2|nr:ABC transporter substrate-binding protein [Nocardia cerradoensis]NKY48510.1 ABC transporter substrate-binding protein [Nocardia cerradoensis]
MRPPSISRRGLLCGCAGLVAAGGLAGLADLGVAAADRRGIGGDRLRIGYLPITDAAPLLIAERGPEFAQPVLFRSWSALAEAFLTRQVDIVHLLMPMAIQLRFGLGAPARILGWNHTNGSALTVAPGITEPGELAGTQVAIPFWWSIHNIVIQQWLRANGLRPVIRSSASRSAGTVELIVMSPSDMIPALANGSISAFTVADPFNAGAELRGVGHIHRFLGDLWRDHACCALVVHQDLLDSRPAVAQAVVDAVVAAQLRIGADRPAAAKQLAGRYLPQPLPAITKALTYSDRIPVRHPGWHPQRIGFQPFPFPSFTAALATAMHDTVVDGDTRFLSRLDPASAHGELVDDRFVRSALDRAGGPAAFGLPAGLTRIEEIDPS